MSYGPVPKHPSERFWSKVSRRGSDECWPWEGAIYTVGRSAGYGFMYAGPLYPHVRWVKAHRLSWEIANGKSIPSDRNVLHHCDNPSCVNPAHLYLGSPKDNARDRAGRGRGRENRQFGENSAVAKLTEADVRMIIKELQRIPRRSQASIAADFGVKQPHISRIMHGISWSHLWED